MRYLLIYVLGVVTGFVLAIIIAVLLPDNEGQTPVTAPQHHHGDLRLVTVERCGGPGRFMPACPEKLP